MNQNNIQEDLNYNKKLEYVWDKNRNDHYWRYHHNSSKLLSNRISLLKPSSVFEVGCNVGRNLWYVSNSIPNICIGEIDISRDAIEFAKKKLPGADLSCENICNLGTDSKYDVVFSCAVMIHL